jgi:hypothetical protein
VNDYTAKDDKELSFKGCFFKLKELMVSLAGDVVILLDCEDDVYWEGQVDEKTGYFPKNYVQQIYDE